MEKTFLKSLASSAKSVGRVGISVAGIAGNAAYKGVKFVAKMALNAVCTSNENSVLTCRYDNSEWNGAYDCSARRHDDCSARRDDCHEVLGRCLLSLTMRRPFDSYLRLILSACEGVDLDGRPGKLVYSRKFRSWCEKSSARDESAQNQLIKEIQDEFNADEIEKAAEIYARLFSRRTYSSYVRECFVVSVGEDVEEYVYDDNGKCVRDANGNYVKKVVGRDDSIAQFKVTFHSGHRIGLKIHMNDMSWMDINPHDFF